MLSAAQKMTILSGALFATRDLLTDKSFFCIVSNSILAQAVTRATGREYRLCTGPMEVFTGSEWYKLSGSLDEVRAGSNIQFWVEGENEFLIADAACYPGYIRLAGLEWHRPEWKRLMWMPIKHRPYLKIHVPYKISALADASLIWVHRRPDFQAILEKLDIELVERGIELSPRLPDPEPGWGVEQLLGEVERRVSP